MAIYVNEDGTVTSLTDEYQTAGTGISGVEAILPVDFLNSTSVTIPLSSAPKLVMCMYTRLYTSSDHVMEIDFSKNATSGQFCPYSAAPNTTRYRYTYSYNANTGNLLAIVTSTGGTGQDVFKGFLIFY